MQQLVHKRHGGPSLLDRIFVSSETYTTVSFELSAQLSRVTTKRLLHMPVDRCSPTNPGYISPTQQLGWTYCRRGSCVLGPGLLWATCPLVQQVYHYFYHSQAVEVGICHTVPKTASPQEHADFRPISITPVLSRTFERVSRVHLSSNSRASRRPELRGSMLSDQLDRRLQLLLPFSSLSYNSYLVVITLDFSKAFDTIQHLTLLHKMASTNTIPDDVYKTRRLLFWPQSLYKVP